MKKYTYLVLLLSLISIPTLAFSQTAEEAQNIDISKEVEIEKPKEKSDFRANFKRVGIELTSTNVKNGDRYENSSISSLSSDSETIVVSVVDFALEYEESNYRWDQIFYSKYGRKKTKKSDSSKSKVDEKDDELRFESDFSEKRWKYQTADIGPFANIGFQTEWTKNKNADRTKVARGKGGLKLFNGKNFSNLYIAGVSEYDITYDTDVIKLAVEIGTNAKFPLYNGVNFEIEGYYRHYVHHSDYIYEDLKYDLNVTGRMNVKINGSLNLSPFISYRYAESRGAGKPGSNFTIGLSGLYSNIFNL